MNRPDHWYAERKRVREDDDMFTPDDLIKLRTRFYLFKEILASVYMSGLPYETTVQENWITTWELVGAMKADLGLKD